VLEAVLAREFGVDQVVVCYPEQLPEFIGARASTHVAGARVLRMAAV
jgi:hypothetical protein